MEYKIDYRMKDEINYGMIDILKLFFAICVVLVHTSAFYSVNNTLFFIINMGLCRIAVPFFFIVSGYFLYNKIHLKSQPSTTLKKMLKFYVLCILLEIITLMPIITIVNRDRWQLTVISIIGKTIFSGLSGSFWYIFSLILSIFTISPLIKKGKIISCFVIGIILYLIGSAGSCYYGIFKNTIFYTLTEFYTSIFILPQIGFTVAIPFLSMGLLINKYKLNEKFKHSGPIILLFVLLLIFESFLLNIKGIATGVDMYLSLLFIVPLILIWAINHKKNIPQAFSNMCRDYSSKIYYIHQIIMYWLLTIFPYTFENTVLRFAITLLVTILIIAIINNIKSNYILRRLFILVLFIIIFQSSSCIFQKINI